MFIATQLPGEAIERLKEVADVEVHPDETLTKSELIKCLQGKDGVVSLLINEIDEEVIKQCPSLKVISNYAVGYNNIDIEAAKQQNIVVTNTPDVLTQATADLAWALLMAVARRIPESDQFVRNGYFTGWKPDLLLGRSVYGKTLGIIGMGRIGEAVAQRAKGFDMRVIYYKRTPLSTEEENALNVTYVSLHELLTSSDFISLHAPLTEKTHHLIDAEEFELMKREAYIINTARGPLINESALVKALSNKEIAGAGLDVFEEEPALAPRLNQLNNVVLAPHIGSATIEARVQMADLAVENLMAVLNGLSPITPVNQ